MFIYKKWDTFCKKLNDEGINSTTASSLLKEIPTKHFIILKHDVETNPSKALKLAEIESKYFHKGSYYVQAYLLHAEKNIRVLKKIQDLGHEISYHHDVMDSNKGDINKAKVEFARNVLLFERYGFPIKTVCQHGNPVIDRVGYTSNRDFFRNSKIRKSFSNISEIMVDYKSRINTEYKYISDAGYGWKVIHDPENNDVSDSSDQNVALYNLNNVLEFVKQNGNVIISTHPHRWHSNLFKAKTKDVAFKIIKVTAKTFIKIPYIKRLMGRFYYLAKKI